MQKVVYSVSKVNKEKNRYDTLDYVETTYFIWYKKLTQEN